MSEVRIALLSVDHEDMEGYTSGLRALLEEHVVSVTDFEWGAVNERHAGRRNFREDGPEELTLYIPDALTVTVSMFMEQMINTANNRGYEDRDQYKTWTLALYEVTDGTVGRVKLLDQCHFTRSGLGRGKLGEGRNIGYARPAGGPLNTEPTFGNAGSLAGRANLINTVKFQSLDLIGRELTANEKTRVELARHLAAGAKVKAVKPKPAEKK